MGGSVRFQGSAPRVCGDDPFFFMTTFKRYQVLPAYAGMIPYMDTDSLIPYACSPRMRG